jgi:hypothetical protein
MAEPSVEGFRLAGEDLPYLIKALRKRTGISAG